jgi:hypothetical protein
VLLIDRAGIAAGAAAATAVGVTVRTDESSACTEGTVGDEEASPVADGTD